jgi:Uma2 family endonuclease
MSSILENPKVREAVYPLSVDFYHQAGELGLIGEDVELLEGTLVKKMPKSPRHEWMVDFLQDRLRAGLPAGWRIRKEGPLTLARSEPEPDLAVVRGTLDDFKAGHPASAGLVIEVAVSTLDLDRQKAAIYAAAGVPEYWLVDPVQRQVEVHRRPEGDGYRERTVLAPPALLAATAVPGLAVDLAGLFAP